MYGIIIHVSNMGGCFGYTGI